MAEQITRVVTEPETDAPGGWWSRYAQRLRDAGLSSVSYQVAADDSSFIAEHGVYVYGEPGDTRWPSSRVSKGVVMGAVQSGKTASMLGVAARALDRNADLVVVLAGTRTTLWKQTYERLLLQLDFDQSENAVALARRRLLIPTPQAVLGEGEGFALTELYQLPVAKARRLARERTPVIAVVMKNVHHLRAFATCLRRSWLPAMGEVGRPVHMLVLDDEADDGSILDAVVEQSRDPAVDDFKQVPRSIVDIWDSRPHSGQTALPNLYVSYVAYTATPQANFLQSDLNPLAPTSFAFTLRTPFDSGELTPRSTTYREPSGLESFYTGGETYYRRLKDAGICRPTTSDSSADLQDALRCFLMASAVRIWRAKGRLRPSQLAGRTFPSRADYIGQAPDVCSLLIHPSAAVADHFEAAAGVLAALHDGDLLAARRRIDGGDRGLDVEGVLRDLAANEQRWTDWLLDFSSSARAVARAFGLGSTPAIPALHDWPEIRDLVVQEVVPMTRVKIINSDPRADDRPQQLPVPTEGGWLAPPDVLTIFVSGNVMSRGLTLEGLTATVFLRSSDEPLADTQMQMQRWFGYRGRYIELCRLFLSDEQLSLFRQYDNTDEALRRSLAEAMATGATGADAMEAFVLQGREFSATGKITNVRNVPLSPGAAPFIRRINTGASPDPNCDVVVDLFAQRASLEVRAKELSRGRILEEPLPLHEVADVLDALRYEGVAPRPDGWEARRWMDLERKIGITESDGDGELLPFFRPPESVVTHELEPGGVYAISAYLRLWKACLVRRASGLVSTDDPDLPWPFVDLGEKRAQEPRFYVGIRYGSGGVVTASPFDRLSFSVRAMKRNISSGELGGSWGSRNPREGGERYLGDALFDYHYHKLPEPTFQQGEPPWRPAGDPGLLLFYVVERDGPARSPGIALGLSLPIGGPDQFAARKPPSR